MKPLIIFGALKFVYADVKVESGMHCWWVMTKCNEKEVLTLAATAFTAVYRIAREITETGPEERSAVERDSYVQLSRVPQYCAGVQEIIFMLIEHKGKCRMCGVTNECKCKILLSRMGCSN